MTGVDKFKAAGEKIKKEVAEKEQKEEEAKEAAETALTQMQRIQANPALAEFYAQNAQVGAENLGGSYPYLRIHTATSTANQLPDGSLPKDGSFFYVPTRQEFREMTVAILTVSRGFKMLQTDKKTGESKKQHNQLVGGVIFDQGKPKPFLMYVNGLKLQNLWSFGKQASQYTRLGIPMFALVVEMTTEQVKSDYGFKWVPKFEIVQNGEDPEVVTDLRMLQGLRRGVDRLSDSIASLIELNEIKEDGVHATQKVTTAPIDEDVPGTEDLPFD